MVEGFASTDKSKPYVPLNSLANDRGYQDGEATATCFCGAVQLAFVSLSPQSLTILILHEKIGHLLALLLSSLP